MSSQSPISFTGPSIEDAAELLRSVAQPLLASLSSHQAELESVSTVSPETQNGQQHPAHSNGNSNSQDKTNGHHEATDVTAIDVQQSADPIKLQIQVPTHIIAAALWQCCL